MIQELPLVTTSAAAAAAAAAIARTPILAAAAAAVVVRTFTAAAALDAPNAAADTITGTEVKDGILLLLRLLQRRLILPYHQHAKLQQH